MDVQPPEQPLPYPCRSLLGLSGMWEGLSSYLPPAIWVHTSAVSISPEQTRAAL